MWNLLGRACWGQPPPRPPAPGALGTEHHPEPILPPLAPTLLRLWVPGLTDLRPFFLLRLLHQLPEERLPRLPAAIVYFLSRHLTSLFSWNNTGVTSNGCRGRDTGARSDGCRGRTLGSRATAAEDGTLGPGAMAAEDGHWGQERR
ncbi:Hypothetical predicted protein [Marmota monax]|uniref:Uncharacterized protein n=1 Tax=Marmota monax TaxID=9995 RepID=A0A5E4C942_MARMO|nr:hypothetical protein GHT09_018765 [Marmota monax]VTJ77679.1 Hypothetical predicted protein [Marmota monax]